MAAADSLEKGRPTMTKRFLLPIILCLLATSLFADSEIRQHFGLISHGNRFAVTRIDRAGDPVSRYTVLIQDENTKKSYRLESTRNFQAQTFNLRLDEIGPPHVFIEAKFRLPLHATSRSETELELRSEEAKHRSVEVTLSTHGASIKKSEADWHSIDASNAKSSLTATLPPDFVSVLNKLQGVAVVPQMAEFCVDFLAYFASNPDCRPKSGVQLVTLPPDCSFDQIHGEPCSDEQRGKVRAIMNNGKGRYY
jgi:hypothetical protein